VRFLYLRAYKHKHTPWLYGCPAAPAARNPIQKDYPLAPGSKYPVDKAGMLFYSASATYTEAQKVYCVGRSKEEELHGDARCFQICQILAFNYKEVCALSVGRRLGIREGILTRHFLPAPERKSALKFCIFFLNN
jgi:hypothetical protein